MSVIAKGRVAAIHYVLRDDDGEVLDSSEGDEPLTYLHGADNVVTGLEEGLEGRSAGDEVTVVVPPDKGYGSAGNPQGGISGTDTLVFVVDILDARD